MSSFFIVLYEYFLNIICSTTFPVVPLMYFGSFPILIRVFCCLSIFIILFSYFFSFSSIFVRPEKFQFLEKWQNRNFDDKIVISVKNLEFIL